MFDRVDPLICGLSLLVSVPILLAALFLIKTEVVIAFVIACFGAIFLNLSWPIVADITM